MTALELASVILAAEFALIASVVLFLLLRRHHRAAAQDHSHAGEMLEQVELTEQTRREALTGLFEGNHGLRGDELESRVNGYLEREKAFYDVMLNIYVERDGEQLRELPKELTKVLAPLETPPSSNRVDGKQKEHLENAKAELAAELDDTKQTLSQMMEEYNAAFGRHQTKPPAAKVAEAPEGAKETDEGAMTVTVDADEAPNFELAEEFEIGESEPPAEKRPATSGRTAPRNRAV